MGSNRFLNSEGQEVDLSELLNEINALSEEVEGKLDRDGTDGGMTGNLDLNSNNISNITNLFANGIDVNFLTITSQLQAQSLVAPFLTALRLVSDDMVFTPDNLPGNEYMTLSVANGIEANTNLDMGGNEINNCSNVISIQGGASIVSEIGSSGGTITYQNFTRVGNSIEGTIRYEGTIITSNSAIILAVPRASAFTNINEASGVASIGDVNGVNTINFSSFNIKAVAGNPWVEMTNSITGFSAGTRTINFKFNYLA